MANENVGDIECPLCKGPAHVRLYHSKKEGANAGKRYVHCAECGPIMTSAPAAQAQIAARAKLYDATTAAPRPAKKKAAVAAAPAATAPARKKTTFELDD